MLITLNLQKGLFFRTETQEFDNEQNVFLCSRKMKKVVQQVLDTGCANNKKLLAVLIDPDKADINHLKNLLNPKSLDHIDMILIGGSVITHGYMDETVSNIKEIVSGRNIPCIIFPGSPDQISANADALLLLSLISGRNPELLIGKHVEAAPALKRSGLELIPTGYILIDGGVVTTVSYISSTVPIPPSKPELAAVTALAGEQLGLSVIYLDAGSGALNPVPGAVIKRVRETVAIPIIVGGGMKTSDDIQNAWDNGADMVVIGNALEADPNLLIDLR